MSNYLDITCVGMAYPDKAGANEALLAAIEEHGFDSDEVLEGFYLAFEPDNKYDANAIAVCWLPEEIYASVDEIHTSINSDDRHRIIGYIPKDGQQAVLDWVAGLEAEERGGDRVCWSVNGVQWVDPSKTKIKWLELQISV